MPFVVTSAPRMSGLTNRSQPGPACENANVSGSSPCGYEVTLVNVSTIAVPMQLEGESLYAASKGAVETFTRVFAREVADFGITCNIVGPTPIETDLIRNVPKDKIGGILQRLAIKRLGRFEDVANVIDFFIRPESDYVTGQVIYLGGVS